jgi:hypothetical protein
MGIESSRGKQQQAQESALLSARECSVTDDRAILLHVDALTASMISCSTAVQSLQQVLPSLCMVGRGWIMHAST